MISEADMERHSLGGLKYIYTHIYIYIWSDTRYMERHVERHSLHGATYGATFATWATFATFASSGLRYIGDMERHSLHGIKSWQMHTHAHFFAFPQCTIGNQVLSTSTRSSSKKIHATACSGIHIGNSNGDRQIGLGEKRKFLAKPDLSITIDCCSLYVAHGSHWMLTA